MLYGRAKSPQVHPASWKGWVTGERGCVSTAVIVSNTAGTHCLQPYSPVNVQRPPKQECRLWILCRKSGGLEEMCKLQTCTRWKVCNFFSPLNEGEALQIASQSTSALKCRKTPVFVSFFVLCIALHDTINAQWVPLGAALMANVVPLCWLPQWFYFSQQQVTQSRPWLRKRCWSLQCQFENAAPYIALRYAFIPCGNSPLGST